MLGRRKFYFLIVYLSLIFSPLFAAPISQLMSYHEFSQLSSDLSKKVNLFREAWIADSLIEFYGGTSRDFIYWVKGQFKNCQTREDALLRMSELTKRSTIDIREFVIGESDIDIISSNKLHFEASKFGLRKIDYTPKSRFDLQTDVAKNEVDQGYIPVEKIRFNYFGFKFESGRFGDGVFEIYKGTPSLTMSEEEVFIKTDYAAQFLNHEILLVLRYMRILAVNYYYEYGSDAPDPEKLFNIDPVIAAKVQSIIDGVSKNKRFRECLKQPIFVTWLNRTIQKAFRAYTNPTATFMLFQKFRLDQFVAHYSEEKGLEPINQYLFAKSYDANLVQERLEKYGSSAEKFFVNPSSIPDLKLFHGTKTEEGFRNILFQGIFPSKSGSAGAGLYAVPQSDLSFSINWGGSKDRIVYFHIKPNARIVDITQGEGQRIFSAFGRDEDSFADYFGVDILKYNYIVNAYVIKNSAVLERPQGLTRSLMTYQNFLRLAENATTIDDILALNEMTILNNFSDTEVVDAYEQSQFLISNLQIKELSEVLKLTYLKLELRQKIFSILLKGQKIEKWATSDSLSERMKAYRATKEILKDLNTFSKMNGFENPSALAKLIHNPKTPATNEVLTIILKKYYKSFRPIPNYLRGAILLLNPINVFAWGSFVGLPLMAGLYSNGEIDVPTNNIMLAAIISIGWTIMGYDATKKAYQVHFEAFPKIRRELRDTHKKFKSLLNPPHKIGVCGLFLSLLKGPLK